MLKHLSNKTDIMSYFIFTESRKYIYTTINRSCYLISIFRKKLLNISILHNVLHNQKSPLLKNPTSRICLQFDSGFEIRAHKPALQSLFRKHTIKAPSLSKSRSFFSTKKTKTSCCNASFVCLIKKSYCFVSLIKV